VIFESGTRIDIIDNKFTPNKVYNKIEFIRDSIFINDNFYSEFFIEAMFTDKENNRKEIIYNISDNEYWIMRGKHSKSINFGEVIEIHFRNDKTFGFIFVKSKRKVKKIKS
tara:strand:- start:45 stop:377 length:333 start_codon:yes stop_codon:yes gene_type:complete